MKATYDWIREYVPDFDGDVEEMCERFTMSGTEVEHFDRRGDDWVIEFSVTSNRVDCMGVLGLARELAAATGLRCQPPRADFAESDAPVDDVCSVQVEDPEGCPRYTAYVVEGVRVGPSPKWLVERLEAIGLRSVNNIVDVTNYVLFETNQPFHAFALDRLEGGRIVVRRGRSGEKLVAINDKEYELTSEMTAITNPSGPVAIAGVMGGRATEVTAATTRILLETAAFDRMRVRATSRRLGLSSDSSFRFERGTDDRAVLDAARRCLHLIVETAGGTVRRGVVDRDAGAPKREPIPFRLAQVARITGIEVPWERCRTIFESLEMAVSGDPSAGICVTPPTYRRDVTREIDLIEEVIRIHGLHHLPLETTMTVRSVRDSKGDRVKRIIKEQLIASGFSETLTTSFVPENEASRCFFAATEPITIRNAMRADENALRQSLLPSLLQVKKVNQDHGNGDIRVFECTVVYLRHGDGIPEHLPILGALMDGGHRELRSVLDLFSRALGIGAVDVAELDGAGARQLDADGGAAVRCDDGTLLGYLGRPLRATIDRFDLKSAPLYLELRLDELVARATLTPHYRPLSRFPAVQRDLAIVVDESVLWRQVEEAVRSLGLPDLDSIAFFDEYRGKQIAAGKKSLAFSLTYRSHDRTLTGAEVDASQSRAIEALRSKLGAQIRD